MDEHGRRETFIADRADGPDAPRAGDATAGPVTGTGATRRAGATGAASLPVTGTGATRRAGATGAASHADELRRLEDVIGGRVLAWVGAVAVLVGLLFLLVIAASRGWIGEEARVVMAATASLVLLAAGAWLHERRGRTDAALAAAATGIAGLFAAIVVAGPVYALVAAIAAIALALGVGAVATLLALRWEAPGIAWLGIVGSLASPLLVGAAQDPAGIAAMLVAYAAAAAVLVRQRWHALAGAAFAIALVQLALWMLDGTGDPAPGAVIAALTTFGAVGAVAAVGFEWRGRAPELRLSALVLLALNALALAGLGAVG